MPNINIAVKNKIARQTNETEYICGNSDFLIDFAFDSEWDAYEKKIARFVYNGAFQEVVFTGNRCEVPIISNTNTILCGVYAGELKTTTPALIPAKKSILCGTPAPAPSTPDVFTQIVALLNMNDTVQRNAEAAALSEKNASASERNAKASEETAVTSAYNAQVAATELDQLKNLMLRGEYRDNVSTSVKHQMFMYSATVVDVTFTEAITIEMNAFMECPNLRNVTFPKVESIEDGAFFECSNLDINGDYDFPLLKTIGVGAFGGVKFKNTGYLHFDNLETLEPGAFNSTEGIYHFYAPKLKSIGAYAFKSSSDLYALVIANTDAVCALENTDAFDRTHIDGGAGYIYVPRAMVDSYKAAENWSAYADNIRALEDYTNDGTITGTLK